ncbi:MAG: PepSY domain-containing protein [Hyphomonas sp.]|nr:PepSY domain-containing protein [Hyphomonas sp.]
MTGIATKNTWLVLHRWFGIVTAAFLLVAAVTGCILTARVTIDKALNADLFEYVGAAGDRLSAVDAVAIFEAAHPGIQVTGFPLNTPPDENIPLSVTSRPGGAAVHADQVFIDPASGAEIGARSTEAGVSRRQFIPLMAELHFNLLAGDAGRIFMGFMALGWLISAAIGLYLTFPRKRPFLRNWWPQWTYSPKRSFARQMLDMHRASGLWLLPFLIVLAFTSVSLNFFGEVYSPAVTTISPLKKSLFDQDMPFPDGTTPDLSYADGYELAREQAEVNGISWQPATMLYYPNWNLYGTTFSDNGVLNYKHLGPIYYYFDASTGEFVHEVNPYTDSAGLVMIRILYPTHSGEFAGGLSVFFIFILGLATAEQCITGIWVWWKKRKPRIAQKKLSKA